MAKIFNKCRNETNSDFCGIFDKILITSQYWLGLLEYELRCRICTCLNRLFSFDTGNCQGASNKFEFFHTSISYKRDVGSTKKSVNLLNQFWTLKIHKNEINMKLLSLGTTLLLFIAAAFANPAPHAVPEDITTTTEFYYSPRLG